MVVENVIRGIEKPGIVPGFEDFGYISLRGVTNVRDLGGMPAANGRRIQPRRLVRSGELHDATAEDMKQLMHMHDVDCIIDFRAKSEMDREPDPISMMTGVKYMHIPVLKEEAIGIMHKGSLVKDLQSAIDYAGSPYEIMSEFYQKAVLGESGMLAYRTFLHDLLEEEAGATLWHCTQGKDRTGIAAILAEYILGVPYEYIRDDYLATNLFVRGWAEKLNAVLKGVKFARQIDMDVEAYAYASMGYFETLLKAVNNAYGSLDNYLVRALDFGPDKQAKLRELYLY